MFGSYLKLAVKVLRRRKFFTFISLFGISMTLLVLVIGATVFDNVFAPRAPESRFDRVVTLNMVGWYGPQDSRTASPGYGFIERYVRPLQGVEGMAIYSNMGNTGLYEGGKRYEATLRRVDGEYWRILDFHFLSGRSFTPQDDSSGALVAVITDGLGQRLFGSQPAVGKAIELDGRRFRIIGVVPRVSLARTTAYSDLWIPIGASRSSEFRSQELGDFNAAILAHSRADLPRIKRQFATAISGAKSDDPKTFTELRAGLDTPFEQAARQLTENRQGDRAPAILRGVILLAMLLFMTLPALNLVTLNLSRILERSSEIGVRKAFGAPRTALILQFVFENVILTLLGGTIAFLLACAVMAALNHVSFIPDANFDVNLRVFGYGMLIAAFFGIFSGVYPAWKMSSLDPVNALRGGAQ